MKQTGVEYLQQIHSNIEFIQQHYRPHMEQADIVTVGKFSRVHKYIDDSFKNGFLSESDLFAIYGYFLQTVKKFKRNVENRIYYTSTDYQATIEKLARMNVKLVPIYTELQLDSDKIVTVDQDTFLDANFAHHIYTKAELCQFTLKLFEQLNYQQFKIPAQLMQNLIYELSINYNVVPYHNFTHAFQLTQLLFSCYHKSKFREFGTPLEIFAAEMAGMAHDLNHKGVNNGYKIKKSKKFNILTSETAVLENMHCATFFNIISMNRDLDFFQYLASEDDKILAKRLIITCVLATDMGKHFKLLGKFQKRVESTTQFQQQNRTDELTEFQRFSAERVDDRQFVLNIMVHACDISNPCMQFQNYMNWSYLLSQEFNDQTLKEADYGVEITGFLIYKDKPNFYNGQIGFSKNLVMPLWVNISILFEDLKYIIITQIMKLYKLCGGFCTINPNTVVQHKIDTLKFNGVSGRLGRNPYDLRIKAATKTIFALQRALQTEQLYMLQMQQSHQEIMKFAELNDYSYRQSSDCQFVQLSKSFEDYSMAITIMPKERLAKDIEQDTLPFHSLDDFEKHYEYLRIDTPVLREDENQRREIIKDNLLDQGNPLGINMNDLIPVNFYITVQKHLVDQLLLIKAEMAEGKIQFSSLCLNDKYNPKYEWHQAMLNCIDYHENEYQVKFMDLSDLLQKNILQFIEAFRVNATDGYYIELMAVHQQQLLYMQWLQKLITILSRDSCI